MSAGKGLDVATIARATFDAVVAHYAAATGITLPSRRIIPPGDVRGTAWDCEQFAVNNGGIVWGPAPGTGSQTAKPTGNPLSSTQVRYTIIVVQIVRPSPEGEDGNPPPAAEVTKAGLALMRDAGLLSQALIELCGRNGALKDHGSAQAGDVAMLGPSGGYAAVEGTLSVTAMAQT